MEYKVKIEYELDDYDNDVKWEWIEDDEDFLYYEVHDLTECPEDAKIDRDLFSCEDYIKAVNTGITLGKLGYDKVVAEYD